jgi:hypothetical protein
VDVEALSNLPCYFYPWAFFPFRGGVYRGFNEPVALAHGEFAISLLNCPILFSFLNSLLGTGRGNQKLDELMFAFYFKKQKLELELSSCFYFTNKWL